MPSHDKKSASELRAELRALRKENLKPISRMRVGDISSEIERLRAGRETTPAVASVPSAPPRKLRAAAETVKEAKRSEFPVMPADLGSKSGGATRKIAPAPPAKKKASKISKLMKMIDEMTDSDEE